ncbi:MAG: hypothetical protein MI861_28025, partial [Pirellulales bacterium]|nr:hypothetical protein [Pirellulales bacterium]
MTARLLVLLLLATALSFPFLRAGAQQTAASNNDGGETQAGQADQGQPEEVATPIAERPAAEVLPKSVLVEVPVIKMIGDRDSQPPPPQTSHHPSLSRAADQKIGLIHFEAVNLSDAMKPFSEQTGLNIICSAEAGKTEITVYLRDVQPLAALEAIVKANGLFYRVDEESGIVRIATANEYEKDLT